MQDTNGGHLKGVATQRARTQQLERASKKMDNLNLHKTAKPTGTVKRKAKLYQQAQGLKDAGITDDWVNKTAPDLGMEE
jgi:hypothetical protein